MCVTQEGHILFFCYGYVIRRIKAASTWTISTFSRNGCNYRHHVPDRIEFRLNFFKNKSSQSGRDLCHSNQLNSKNWNIIHDSFNLWICKTVFFSNACPLRVCRSEKRDGRNSSNTIEGMSHVVSAAIWLAADRAARDTFLSVPHISTIFVPPPSLV